MRKLGAVLAVLLLFCSCAAPAEEGVSPVYSSESSGPAEAIPAPERAAPSLVEQLALDIVAPLNLAALPPEQAVQTLYRFLIERVYLSDPVGLDSWRYLTDSEEAIPYLENRALSPLLFRIGSCEDFAAAMVMLLRAAGFEAEYVAGYTLSIKQIYVDHAWVVVKLGQRWYHLDPQLEQNIVRGNQLRYRFFLRSDAEMDVDHKWGESLISFWPNMTEAEKEQIRREYTPPRCPISGPPPPPEPITLPPVPNRTDVEAKISRIKFESQKGELPPLPLNVEPPILVAERHVTPPLSSKTGAVTAE